MNQEKIKEENVRKAIERLNCIDWQLYTPQHAGSHLLLMEEYLRRSAVWAKALNWMEGSGWPFFDLSEHLDPSIETDPIVIAALKTWKNPGGINLTERMCKNYLYFAALKHKPEVVKLNLPEPYEPLILIVERGGGFSRELKFIELPGTATAIRKFEDYLKLPPVLNFDEATLKQADLKHEEWKRKNFPH